MQQGIVRFGYFHLAVLGPESELAAQASECAGEQDAFWPYHDRLFQAQQGKNQGAYAKPNLVQMAGELGLNRTGFEACLDSGRYAAEVRAETAFGQMIGVRATPTFLINGRPVMGALPIEQFRDLIETARGQ